ncbi:MAG: carboxypeptidase regulatory-like domain-containing protein [Verrucomicrobia bacterium]|nr:carboxypeptidase regulatory-like domain-containing protein [Verrucomicrobiota bacterium]
MKLPAFVAVLLLATRAASGFVVELGVSNAPLHWDLITLPDFVPTNNVNPATRAIRFALAPDTFSTTNNTGELDAIRASFGQWQAISGTHLKFEEGPLLAPGVHVNTDDSVNAVSWAKTNTMVNDTDDIVGRLGVAFWSEINNAIVEADIVFNAVPNSLPGGDTPAWFADFSDTNSAAFFVEAVLLHEIGHFLGLLHSPVGGATMLSRGGTGVTSTQAGLSPDEIAAARYLYPASALTNLAVLRGTVTRDSAGVLGAIVIAEDAAGNVAAGTLSEADGQYTMPALPPGNYQVRATPMDPNSASYLLEWAFDFSSRFFSADGNFLATTNTPVTLTAGSTNTLNFSVTAGPAAFFIGFVMNPKTGDAGNTPGVVYPGQSNLTVGVLSADVPTNGVALGVSGDGLTVGPTTVDTESFAHAGLKLVSAPLSVAANATPGSRTILIEQETNRAYANGFLEILPLAPDDNFDGLDDRFQRKHFPVFTTSAAAPAADPDGDGLNNLAEFTAGTTPTNALSVLRLERVIQNAGGTTVLWQSVAEKSYRVSAREQLNGANWQLLGTVTATNAAAQFLDPAATNAFRFYRVEVLQ